MTKPELIVMLTWNDKTVEGAKKIFLEAKDAPARYWGCKREGISEENLRDLLLTMKENGKETFMETIAIDEEPCLETARIAASCGAEHLIGTVYFDSVKKICDEAGMTYYPFIGLGSDTHLHGTPEIIAADAKRVENKGVTGISLSAFRYTEGDPLELLKVVSDTVNCKIILAGSVNSTERIDVLKATKNLFGFTIGGAFFENVFGNGFSEQIKVVSEYILK
ncbi:MAG: hypothetical protein GX222_06490 [Ruminococcaceae bacterium]|nr:hypothetical protein [Oscillospiraceae bacterium]